MSLQKTPPSGRSRRSGSSKSPSHAAAAATSSPHKKLTGRARVLSSKTAYKGKVFSVTADEVEEPGGVRAHREVVRHNGSVVILAVDYSANPDDPTILLIRQYRHAANRFLLELPAGRIEPGERLIPAARRELLEETGYRAKRWSSHVKYYASPGFLAEAMNILLAEDLVHGEATPEDDERISIHPTPLSEAVRLALAGDLHDGKTLIGILFFAALRKAFT